MVLGSLTERVSVLSSGDGGLGGVMCCWREGQSHPHLPLLHFYSLYTTPPPPHSARNVPEWRRRWGEGGNQRAWIAAAHYKTAGH